MNIRMYQYSFINVNAYLYIYILIRNLYVTKMFDIMVFVDSLTELVMKARDVVDPSGESVRMDSRR